MPPRDGNSRLGHPDVAGWVLGALDPDDAERFAEHLLSCEECQAAVTELEPVAKLLKNPIAEVDTAAPPVESRLAATVLPLAADGLPFPLHAESNEAPPAAAAKRRNARRAGAWPPWFSPSAIAVASPSSRT